MTLIERLEAATGPDRELDAEIALVTGWGFDPEFLTLQWTSPDGQISKSLPPNFTGSIDAAATLVPDGDPWTVGQNIYHRWWVASIHELGPDQEIKVRGTGASSVCTPFALCIAALRARGVK